MKKNLLLILILAFGKLEFAQTAVDFTAPDCSGTSHNLFTELNAGKIIVLVWVMPCGTCISDAKAGYDAAQSFATSNPGRVIYWLVDDIGNSTCSTVSSWANTNGIVTNNITVFSNSGNKIDEANYGGSAMPHVLVLGGMNHRVYYNKRNGNNDGAAITSAIDQVLASGIVAPNGEKENPIEIYPNPAKDKITLIGLNDFTTYHAIEIYDVFGKEIHAIKPSNKYQLRGALEISLPPSIPSGNYMLRIKNETESYNLRFMIVD